MAALKLPAHPWVTLVRNLEPGDAELLGVLLGSAVRYGLRAAGHPSDPARSPKVSRLAGRFEGLLEAARSVLGLASGGEFVPGRYAFTILEEALGRPIHTADAPVFRELAGVDLHRGEARGLDVRAEKAPAELIKAARAFELDEWSPLVRPEGVTS